MANGEGENSDGSISAEDVKQIGQGVGAAASGIGSAIGAAQGNQTGGGGGRVAPAQTPDQPRDPGSMTCTPTSVATEISLGMRDKRGYLTEKGKQEGLPQCSDSVRKRGVQMYEREFGGSPSAGSQTAGPTAPAEPMQGSESEVVSASEIPSSIQFRSVPNSMLKKAVNLAKKLVSNHGQNVAQGFLSALAGALGRRLNPNPIDPMCAEELVNEIPEKWRGTIRLWQCGADQPFGQGPEGQKLWLALQLATGSLDFKTGTQCRCVQG